MCVTVEWYSCNQDDEVIPCQYTSRLESLDSLFIVFLVDTQGGRVVEIL